MSKSLDAATGAIHLQGIGRVPAVAAYELKVGDQLMYNGGSVYQITKIENVSPKILRIFEVSAETGEEHNSRVKKDRLVARVHQEDRRPLGHDAPATVYRAQVYAPQGGLWTTVSHGATAEVAADGRTRRNQFSYFASVLLDRHGLGGTYEVRAANTEAMADGKTLTAEDGHRFRILPPEQPQAEQVNLWSVQDREGNEIAEVKATDYNHAVQVAAQEPKVRAAEPGSGGLVYIRRGALQEAVPVAVPDRSVSTYGALGATLEVPQVDAAIRVLKAGRQTLAAFADTGHCVSAGAYLDARWNTGEVVLSFEREHTSSYSREWRAEQEPVVVGYENLFHAANWNVSQCWEADHDRAEWLVRLILTPPITVMTGFTRKSGSPGGEELTPGEAAERFLS
ncbi:hypothetical protein AB0H92_22105 [Streptomyces phaeochromogenes]|uniref:hypothetical protein n=1 Tax=Streptomyces phaeochromogenes TaxID=1923 RepID=UPI0033D3B810